MLAVLLENFYMIGLKSLLKQTKVLCWKSYAHVAGQLMGQLPAEHVDPAPPFTHVEINYARPFFI